MPKICVEEKLLPKYFKEEKIGWYLIKQLSADPIFLLLDGNKHDKG